MKKIACICVSILCFLGTYAQDFKSLAFNLPNNTLVEMAVSNGVFLMSHSYQLCDTTTMQKFGRYGNTAFGNKSGLAVKIKGGYILPNALVSPWDFDENFNKYKGKYIPVSYQIKSKNLSDSTTICMYDAVMPKCKPLAGTDFSYVADSTSFDGNGFKPCETEGNKDGWCIWYTAEKEISSIDSLITITTISAKHEISVKKGESTYEVSAPKTDSQLLGGLFIVPVKSGIGNLTFELVGIISTINSKWNIVIPFMEDKPTDELSPIVETPEAPKSAVTTEKQKTGKDDNTITDKKKKGKK